MSSIEVVANGVIFRNPYPGHRIINAYLPFILELSEQEWLCIYRRASAFYSPDGVLVKTRTLDGGKTWQEEGLVCDPHADEKVYSYSAPFLAKLGNNSLVLTAFRTDCSDFDQLMVNPETGGFLPTETLLFQSSDSGHHWSAPQRVRLPEGIIADLAGPVVQLNDGRWFLPFDIGKAYDDPDPVKPVMLGFLSGDQGQTWGDMVSFADGAPMQKAHWHGRVIRLDDGRLFTLVWTEDLQKGHFVDLHRTVSNQRGRPWDVPKPTGIPGQTSWAVDLGDGRMFAAYTVREVKPPGIRAVLSRDEGQTWDLEHEIILWDATGRETIGVATKDVYPVSHDVIAFGRPQATRTRMGDVLVTFWCTEACMTEARWFRLALGK